MRRTIGVSPIGGSTMPLDQLSNIAEIIAAALVIVSLIYVGLQVRQSTKAAYASTNQAHAEIANGMTGLINASNNLADILHQGASGLSSLKEGNLIRFMAFHDQIFVAYQGFYFQYLRGALDRRIWDTYKQATLSMLAQPGQQEWWKLRRSWFSEEFRNYVDDIATKEQGRPMHHDSVAG